jgi:hypothetical protein
MVVPFNFPLNLAVRRDINATLRLQVLIALVFPHRPIKLALPLLLDAPSL